MWEFLKAVSLAVTSLGQRLTPEGGNTIYLINKTGAPSVRGMVVEASTTTDGAFGIPGVDDNMPIGVVYDNGLADGQLCRIVISGIADVLLTDGTGATHGGWVRTGTALGSGGRAIASAAPPGGGIPELEQHMAEIGHSLQTVAPGVSVLCRCLIHFN